MDGLFEFGMIIGFLTALYVVILKVPSSPKRKTAGSTLYGPTRPGLLTHLTSLFPLQLQDLLQGILVARFARLTDSFLWPHNKGMCFAKSASKFLFHY